jgi:hypothetical protein
MPSSHHERSLTIAVDLTTPGRDHGSMNNIRSVVSLSPVVPILFALGCTDRSQSQIGQAVDAFGSVGDEVTLYQTGSEPFPGIVDAIGQSGCPAGTSNCSQIAWVPATGINPHPVSLTTAPLCQSAYNDGGAVYPTPSPCWDPDGARGLPSATSTQGSAVVAFYPDNTRADAELALVNDPTSVEVTPVDSGGIVTCSVDGDCTLISGGSCLSGYCAYTGLSQCAFPSATSPCWDE